MSPRPTLYDVARLAGVSTATVSFTFSKPDRVKPETRTMVMDAARQVGYVPRASARNLARGRTGALGLYSFDMLTEDDPPVASHDVPGGAGLHDVTLNADEIVVGTGPGPDTRTFPLYVDEVQRGFEMECWRQGLALVLSSTADPSTTVWESGSRVDGLAVLPGYLDLEALDVVARSIPVVLLSRYDALLACDRVIADNVGAMLMLADHLVRSHGVNSVGFIGDINDGEMAERYGVLSRWSESVDNVTVEHIESGPPLMIDRLAPLVERVGKGDLPEALVCGSDQMALEVLDVLAAEQVSVPDDVLVTGFDGILASRLSAPTLTTVRQPMEAMGSLAARLLTVKSRSGPALGRTYRVRTELTLGQSCGCIPIVV